MSFFPLSLPVSPALAPQIVIPLSLVSLKPPICGPQAHTKMAYQTLSLRFHQPFFLLSQCACINFLIPLWVCPCFLPPPCQYSSAILMAYKIGQHFISFSHQMLGTFMATGEEEVKRELMNNNTSKRKALVFMAAVAVSRFRSVLASAIARRQGRSPRVVGTLYGRRRGHVHLIFQLKPQMQPLTLLELPTATNEFVKEMASSSGLMRIALECDRGGEVRLIEEPMWRVYCNGLRCGYAFRRECRAEDWKALGAVEKVSVGGGVLPAGEGVEGEVIYMRAMFERVVGSKDTEALYMISPDGHAGPELSVFLLRV